MTIPEPTSERLSDLLTQVRGLVSNHRDRIGGTTITTGRDWLKVSYHCGPFIRHLQISALSNSDNSVCVSYWIDDVRDRSDWNEEQLARRVADLCFAYRNVPRAAVTARELDSWLQYCFGEGGALKNFTWREDELKAQEEKQRQESDRVMRYWWFGITGCFAIGGFLVGGTGGAVLGLVLGYFVGALVGAFVTSW